VWIGIPPTLEEILEIGVIMESHRRQKNISKIDYILLVIYMWIVFMQLIFRKIFPSVKKGLENEIVLVRTININ